MQSEWQEKFRRTSIKVGFQVSLTRPMLEMLCAVADGVMWDRSMASSLAIPDNWIATNASLERRGLVVRKPKEKFEAELSKTVISYEWNHYELTPAGQALVELLKVAGLFVVSDVALARQAREEAQHA